MSAPQRGGPPRNAGAPGVGTRGGGGDTAQSTGHRAEDGFAAPTAEDRADAEVIAAAQARGFRIAVPCLVCGRFLTQKSSVAAHVGPTCRKRVAK